jgi:hypothetical protein
MTVGLAAAPSVAGAAGSTTQVVVTSADLYNSSACGTPQASTAAGQWNVVDQSNACPSGGGSVGIVSTPAPTSNQGSLQLSVTGAADHWSAYSQDFGGTALSDITSLSYSTYSSSVVETDEDPVLQLVIDPGPASAAGLAAGCVASPDYSNLNFEPYLQNSDYPAVADSTWQTWDELAGGGNDADLWATHVNSDGNNQPTGCAVVSGGTSWSTFLSYYPSAVIIPGADGGGAGVNVGSGWSNPQTFNVGSFTIGTSAGTTNYTFDPSAPTTTTTTKATTSDILLGSSNSDSATVTGNSVVGNPTGTVQFYECGPTPSVAACTSTTNPVGNPVSVTAGAGDTSTAASPSFTPNGTGYWCFAGVYSGDSNYAGSSDTLVSNECFQVVAASATSTVPSSSTITLGGSVTDGATVTGNSAQGNPTGSVSFYYCGPSGSPVACSAPSHRVGLGVSLTAGANSSSTATSASFTPSSTGYWCFKAVYSGDTNYATSADANSGECFDVTPAGSTTQSTPTLSTIVLHANHSDADSVTVTGIAAVGAPTGSVSFYECGPSAAAAPCTSTTGNQVGSAVMLASSSSTTSVATSAAVTPTAGGYWCFGAHYAGSASYSASSDTSTDECFNVTPTLTTISSKPTNRVIHVGQSDTDVATVVDHSELGIAPSGTVSFYECGPSTAPARCTSVAHPVGAPVSVTVGSRTSVATSAAFTPTAVGYWCFGVRFNANASYGASSAVTTAGCVNVEGPPVILTNSLPSGTKDATYQTTLSGRGGTTPYTWSHTGKLPYGITLTKTGLLTGIPKVSGTFEITVILKDSSHPQLTASKVFDLVIAS